MPELYDEDGNVVSNVYTQEQVDELKAKTELAEAERVELEKLRQKDMNFSKFRKQQMGNQTSEETPPATPPVTPPAPPATPTPAPPTPQPQDQEALAILRGLNVVDEGLQKKALYYYNKLAGDTNDPVIREMFMKNAINMANSGLTPGGSGIPTSSAPGSHGGVPPAASDYNPEMASVFGIDKETHDKYSQEWKPNYGNRK